ncbi:hypothetical protein OE88DRAFT_1441160 [Heliocybe sulcata]|uniref:Uncharacterized protein n=1 Tax=Heliocybe sulcata TaxID=5364 RepID=A0A5C3N8A1_9AGAM|nr:hypothetical protein OE88DRAFT_1441160 [Heliocybe sulcata]
MTQTIAMTASSSCMGSLATHLRSIVARTIRKKKSTTLSPGTRRWDRYALPSSLPSPTRKPPSKAALLLVPSSPLSPTHKAERRHISLFTIIDSSPYNHLAPVPRNCKKRAVHLGKLRARKDRAYMQYLIRKKTLHDSCRDVVKCQKARMEDSGDARRKHTEDWVASTVTGNEPTEHSQDVFLQLCASKR